MPVVSPNAKVRSLSPDSITMGNKGLAERGIRIESGHPKTPLNSIPMRGGPKLLDCITMADYSQVLDVREYLEHYGCDSG